MAAAPPAVGLAHPTVVPTNHVPADRDSTADEPSDDGP